MGAEWETRRVMAVLDGLVADAWSVIEPNLDGLTDDEYLWEPVEGCWSIRPRSMLAGSGFWGKGDWVVEVSLDGSSEPAAHRTTGGGVPAGDFSTRHCWSGSTTVPSAAVAVRRPRVARGGRRRSGGLRVLLVPHHVSVDGSRIVAVVHPRSL